MVVSIDIRLIAGRYHATPWNRQVNEERVEWPPSPWRVLRSLVAKGYHLEIPREQIVQLMSQLASELPVYQLPPTTTDHTRHWMPIVGDKGPTTSKVWDTFLTTEKSAQIVMSWQDLELSEADFLLLQQLCQSVSYLGRAESWAALEANREALPPEKQHAYPVEEGGDTRLLAPLNSQELLGFRHAIAALPRAGKTPSWKVPQDLLEVLSLSVADYHAQGWSNVPGAKWVSYRVEEPSDDLPGVSTNDSYTPFCDFARFALVAPVLPLATKALSIGERFRQALLSRSNSHPVFSGKGEDGKSPSNKQHQHAYYLPEINERGQITHILVYAKGGFELEAAQALCRLQRIWDNITREREIQVVLVSLGWIRDYSVDLTNKEEPTKGRSLLLSRAQVWKSVTPLVLPRYPMYRQGKPRIDPVTGLQKECAEYQILKMLERLGYPQPSVQEVTAQQCGSKFPWLAFGRQRQHGLGSKGPDKGFGFRLEFPHPVWGPIALGYASHFGLGVFQAEL
jgi:CRISPR-associated protein Csb2